MNSYNFFLDVTYSFLQGTIISEETAAWIWELKLFMKVTSIFKIVTPCFSKILVNVVILHRLITQ